DREAARIGDCDQVGIVRPLADVAGREAGKARALAQQVVEMVRGDELRARLAVHVDELREQELDLLLLDDRADVVGALRWRSHAPEVYRGGTTAGNGAGYP